MVRSAVRLMAVLGAVAGGIGWLYLLRDWRALGAGPRFAGALPLERLARADAQPLLRLGAAWLPAGLAAGFALAATGVRTRRARALVVAAVALAAIFLTSAASEAVTGSEQLSRHLGPAAGRAALWLAAGMMTLGALIPPPTGRPGRGPARARDARRRREDANAAA